MIAQLLDSYWTLVLIWLVLWWLGMRVTRFVKSEPGANPEHTYTTQDTIRIVRIEFKDKDKCIIIEPTQPPPLTQEDD